MRENFTYGLMRGRWRRAAGLLDRDTHPKGEKRSGVAGPHAIPRHCSTLQLRNVRDHLPPHLQAQVTSAMRAAFRLTPEQGSAKLKQQASWLEREYPDAAGSLREGLEEMFTINRLGLTPALCRALGSTNIIENPNSTARRKTNRVTRWRDGAMVKRWAAAAFLDAERSFRRILGYRDLWTLKAILNENQVANGEKAA
jgi:putative transposase